MTLITNNSQHHTAWRLFFVVTYTYYMYKNKLIGEYLSSCKLAISNKQPVFVMLQKTYTDICTLYILYSM